MGSEDRNGSEAVVRVGVVLPVHNEEAHLLGALQSLDRAMRSLTGIVICCQLVVVLDDCTDRSADIVRHWVDAGTVAGRVDVISIGAKNVGLARRAGSAALMGRWAGTPAGDIWLATTDADSEVPPDWLAAQIRARAEGAHLWVGRVEVRCWDDRSAGTADAWGRHYALEHQPVHGANLGVDAAMYLGVGGFEGRASGEDRDLVDRILLRGAVVRADTSVRVVTSGRRMARAPGGFAQALSSHEQSLPVAAVAS